MRPDTTRRAFSARPGTGQDGRGRGTADLDTRQQRRESAEVAGRRGLRFAANYHVSPATVIEAVDGYRAAFQSSGELGRPYVSVSADVVAADTEARARELAAGYGPWVRSIRTAEGAIQFPTPGRPAAISGQMPTVPWSPTASTPSSSAPRDRSLTSLNGCATRPRPTS